MSADDLLDQIKDQISAMNESYAAGYRDAKLELRRRLRVVTDAASDDPADQAQAIIAVVTAFL